MIASNIYDQVDKEGYREHSVYEIVDHRKTADAVDKDDQYMTRSQVRMGSKKSTAGWELKVRTKLALDDSYNKSWMP